MEKKKGIRIGIAALAAVAALGAGAFFATHTHIDGAFFSKKADVIDLTDHDLSAQEYEALRQQFPDKQILWTVPFQGSRYSVDTKTVTVSALTEEDVLALDHLGQLQSVDATNCTDYEALMQLQQRRPDCQVMYRVSIGDVRCGSQDTELSLTDVSASQLEQALAVLPKLETVTLEGQLPSGEELRHLQETFPGVTFRFALELGGQTFSSDAASMDLQGAAVTLAELQQALPLLSNVEAVDLMDTALTDSELKELAGSFPEIFFLCNMEVAGKTFPTDTTEIDLTNCPTTVEEVEALLPYFPNLTWMDMSWCGIADEDMDAFNRRYPDIKILWSMQIGLVTLRTDAIYFFPASIEEMNLPKDDDLKKLRYCTEMIAIDIGHSKATNCEWVAYMPHLKYLILADTKITDISPLANLKELIYLELFLSKVKDFTPLTTCKALEDLNLCYTRGSFEPIGEMTWLKRLWFSYSISPPLTEAQKQALREALPNTQLQLEPCSATGGGWRQGQNYYDMRDLMGMFYIAD